MESSESGPDCDDDSSYELPRGFSDNDLDLIDPQIDVDLEELFDESAESPAQSAHRLPFATTLYDVDFDPNIEEYDPNDFEQFSMNVPFAARKTERKNFDAACGPTLAEHVRIDKAAEMSPVDVRPHFTQKLIT